MDKIAEDEKVKNDKIRRNEELIVCLGSLGDCRVITNRSIGHSPRLEKQEPDGS